MLIYYVYNISWKENVSSGKSPLFKFFIKNFYLIKHILYEQNEYSLQNYIFIFNLLFIVQFEIDLISFFSNPTPFLLIQNPTICF